MDSDELDPQSIDSAAAWFVRLRGEPLSVEAQRRFTAWLAEDIRHVRAMDAVDAVWRQSAVLADRRDPRVAGRTAPRRTRLAPSPVRRRWSSAAVGALAACLCAFIGTSVWTRVYAPVSYQAPIGAPLATTLSDGSVMTLEAGSMAIVKLTPLARDIHLVSGAGEYEVAHGQARPFVVNDGRISVRATGTRFTVRRGADRSDVVLEEGSVDLINPGDGAVRARMNPGEHAVIMQDGRLWVSGPAAVNAAAELGTVLEFDRTSLRDALAQFNAGSSTTATLADPALGDIEISGVYRRADLTAFLDGLTRIEDVEWRRRPDGSIVIEPAS